MTPSRGIVVWLTGLPASGKSTLARAVAAQLAPRAAVILDGDDVRAALHPSPGYDDESRAAFYETLAGVAALIARQGHVVLVPATAHRRAYRARARELAPRFLEVHVATPLAECRRRDPKGLYAHATPGLPGAGTPFETPEAPDLVVAGSDDAAVIADRVLVALGT
jgi:adenylylsulfate kinase